MTDYINLVNLMLLCELTGESFILPNGTYDFEHLGLVTVTDLLGEPSR